VRVATSAVCIISLLYLAALSVVQKILSNDRMFNEKGILPDTETVCSSGVINKMQTKTLVLKVSQAESLIGNNSICSKTKEETIAA
jgi:hypothetical protein